MCFGVGKERPTQTWRSVHWHFCDGAHAHSSRRDYIPMLHNLALMSDIQCARTQTTSFLAKLTQERGEQSILWFFAERKIDKILFLSVPCTDGRKVLKRKFTWHGLTMLLSIFFHATSECWPQVQVPLQERTTAIHRTQRPTDRRLDNNHQGVVSKVREGHWRGIDQRTEEHLSRHDLDGREPFDFRHLVLARKESRRDDQRIQNQLSTVLGQQDPQRNSELLLQAQLRTSGKAEWTLACHSSETHFGLCYFRLRKSLRPKASASTNPMKLSN